jgi:glycosyltransferase involved in cell wall biosynthesis
MLSKYSFASLFRRLKSKSVMSSNNNKRILLLASLRPGCGNTATASRIAHNLRTSTSWTVDCISTDAPHTEFDSFSTTIRRYDVIVALHAYRAGHLLNSIYNCEDDDLPPLILIFAGTDLHSCEPKWISTVQSIIPHANGLVCFNADWKKYVETTYQTQVRCKITVIPQSVLILPFIFEQLPSSLHTINHRKVLLWIGEIRSVKDPLFIIRFLSQLNNDAYHLFLVGYEHDSSLSDDLRSLSSSQCNVTLLGGRSQNFVHTLIRTSFAYINTSINEGMCLAILEAMALGVPVIARRNTGNASLVQNGKTGLLFDTPDQAVEHLIELDQNLEFRHRIIRQAADYVRKSHNSTVETKAYERLLLNSMK